MTQDDPERQLSAALRAQAAVLVAGQPASTGTEPAGESSPASTGTDPVDAAPGSALPGWLLLGLAVLLGGLAGALAGAISAW